MTIDASREKIITRPARSPGPPLRAAIGLAFVVLLLFGMGYSLLATGLGRVLFPHQATGSLLERDGVVVGSSLVAQPFADDRYFQSRPSAAGYDPMALAGSNQARSNPDLRSRVQAARAAVASREGVAPDAVPGDLVTQSGGGIDPHIGPAAAGIQVERVARARGLGVETVAGVVARHTRTSQSGFPGQARVNVLELNLALDAMGERGGAQ